MKLPDHLHDFALKLARKIAPNQDGQREFGFHPEFAVSFRSFVQEKLGLRYAAVAAQIPDCRFEYQEHVERLRNNSGINSTLSQLKKRNAGHEQVLVLLAWIVVDKDRSTLYWSHVRELGFSFLDGFEVPLAVQIVRTEEARLVEIANSTSFIRIKSPTDSVLVAREITQAQKILINSQGEATKFLPNSYSEVAQDTLLSQLYDFMLRNRHRAPFSNLTSEMVKWYRIGHWSDERAHASRFAMEPVVRLALETAGSFSNPQTLELALQYAHSCKLMKLDDRRRWVMNEVEKLPDLPQEKQARTILLQYTDGLLNAQAGQGQLAPDGLLERMKVQSPIVQACVWRCAACLSLSRKAYDQATSYVEMARSAFSRAASTDISSMSDEDMLIPLYLDTIHLIVEIETNQKVTSRHIENLNQIIFQLDQADENASTFLVGLFDLKIQLIIRKENGFNEPICYRTYHDITKDLAAIKFVKSDLQKAVKDFCFFDMQAVEKRISEW